MRGQCGQWRWHLQEYARRDLDRRDPRGSEGDTCGRGRGSSRSCAYNAYVRKARDAGATRRSDSALRAKELHELGDRRKKVLNQAVVCDLEDRRVAVLVDGHDDL